MKNIFFLLFFSAGLLSFSKGENYTTLILVRHAEKNNESDSSTLTPAGYERAQRISDMLANTDIAAIYATPFIRMILTASPTAVSKNLPVTTYQPHEMSEIDQMASSYKGKTILVIGHSNTIPKIINHYTGSALENLTSYTDLFILHIAHKPKLKSWYLHLTY
ncbi:MAG: histidine phosphatase family protein [Crocinitomicaceae bacterium]|nr:histidine phosphatase family protein [Crocinitomicaceae bacterium]MBK8925159.1 histidine phosphatase family protein [Crocinitomicaceae bacterium]